MTAFHGVFAVIDEETSDGRLLAPDSVTWRRPPLPLLAMRVGARNTGHHPSRILGRINRVWIEDNEVRGQGRIDTDISAERDDRLARAVRAVTTRLETGVAIWGGADFDDVLIDGDSGVMVFNKARLVGFTLYLGGTQDSPASTGRTWIKEGPWPA